MPGKPENIFSSRLHPVRRDGIRTFNMTATEHPLRTIAAILTLFVVAFFAAAGAVWTFDALAHGTTAARLARCEGAAARCAAHVGELAKECR